MTDASNTVSCSLAALSNEPANELCDGNKSVDAIVLEVHNMQLRAERAGNGGGRTYTATLTCADSSGNFSTAAAFARVVR